MAKRRFGGKSKAWVQISSAGLVPLLWAAGASASTPPPAAPLALSPQAATAASTTEQTRAVANRFLRRMFVDNNVRAAYDENAAENLIQHNPEMGDGLEAHRAFFREKFRKNGPATGWANVINMILVDGDLFAVHHHLYTGPQDSGRVFVDIWRVADGKIVEHWDVIEAIPTTFANNNGVGCGDARDYQSALKAGNTVAQPTCGWPDASARREDSLAVLQSYAGGLKSGNVAAAIERWLSDDYRQHSPLMEDGKAGALAYLGKQFGNRAQAPKMGPSRLIADGNFVLDHRMTTKADGSQTVYVDIFRITNGKISEHWDVKQPVAANQVNPRSMW